MLKINPDHIPNITFTEKDAKDFDKNYRRFCKKYGYKIIEFNEGIFEDKFKIMK